MPTRKNKPKKRTSRSKKPVIKKVDYIGLDHKVVNEKVNPNVKFVNYMSIESLDGKNSFVAAVYYDPKPNRELKHSEYMLIYTVYDPFEKKSNIYVTGRTVEQMEAQKFHQATLCTECNQILISLSGHHFHSCGCKNDMFVDGGQSKWGTRVGAHDLSKAVPVRVNMLTDEFEILERGNNAKKS